MPFTHKEETSTGTTTKLEIPILAERGTLQAVTFGVNAISTGMASVYAQVYLSSNETPENINIALLCSGYVGGAHTIGWTGLITLLPTYLIRAEFWTRESTTCRLSVVTDVEPLTSVPS